MGLKNIQLPDLGEGVTEGEMIKWLVKVGDTIKADEPIAEFMTDKATVEVPSPFAGVVKELKVKEGDMIPIMRDIMVLEESGETDSPQMTKPPQSPISSSPSPDPILSTQTEVISPPVAQVHVLATPATRRLARELKVDINKLQGTGLAGRVNREDVLKYVGKNLNQTTEAVSPPQSKPSFSSPKPLHPMGSEKRVPLRGIRRKVAEAMKKSKHIIPHFTLMDEAHVRELIEIRKKAKAGGKAKGVNVTYLPFVMKALLATLRDFPALNASIDDAQEEIVYKNYFHLGFAADTPQGLMVPVIQNADQKTILQVSQEIQELSQRAREGRLKPEELKGSTITLTNIGSLGGQYATPIINHPEVALLGMYRITEKPYRKNGETLWGSFMNFSLTADHRLIDGAVAARFLTSFIKRIENPSHLILDMS